MFWTAFWLGFLILGGINLANIYVKGGDRSRLLWGLLYAVGIGLVFGVISLAFFGIIGTAAP
ncbi:hypothetical protein GCM10023184_00140 [Flaviaesturariibacter amylovorans]|uniref:Uncharacterized protein n=1 Tax=Flaviaesturariibacter amylovorans TaxID=1084520 RepID=A0ABP8G3M1_9BACT